MSVAVGWAGLLEGEELAHLEEAPARGRLPRLRLVRVELVHALGS